MPTNPIYSGTPISSLMNEDNGYDPEITSLLKRLENLDDKHEKIAKEIDENINIRGKFLCMIGHRGYLTSDYVKETFPKDIHETLLKFNSIKAQLFNSKGEYKMTANQFEIKIRVEDESELYNSFDPTETTLSDDLTNYICHAVKNQNRGEKTLLHIISKSAINEEKFKKCMC